MENAVVTEQDRILVVEDDPDTLDIVVNTLEDSGFEVVAHNSAVGVPELLESKRIDLVLLDLGLPGGDGLTLLRQIKAQSEVGVLIVSGRSEPLERVVGLEVGADDYLTKPFLPRELLARVRSVLRRLPAKNSMKAQGALKVLKFSGFSLDEARMEVRDPEGHVVPLTSGEYALLDTLAKHPHRVITRDRLLDLTRGNDFPAFDRSIDVLVARLRKKLGDNPPMLIKTVRNQGYIFTAGEYSN